MSSKVTINGNEYSYGEVVESEFFDDKSKEIVLNGEVVKVGDVWLTRELKEVVITNINIGHWPIRDNKERTYSVYGIADCDYKISGQDLMTKYVKDTEDVKDAEDVKEAEDVKDVKEAEDVKDTEDVKVAEDVKDTEDVKVAEDVKDTEEFGSKPENTTKDLPILDIQVGDVWRTASGNEVEIASHMPGTPFVWCTTCDISYTDRGTYFSMMASTRDLVQRISRNTEIKEALVQEPEMPKQEAFVQPISCNSTNVTISNVCKQGNDISFEDAVQMNIDNLVSLIGDRMSEKAKSRDITAVKYLTKVLEKVIALESL